MKKSKRNYIRNVLTYLEPISKVPPKRRNNIVPLLSDETIHKLCESCQNLLPGPVYFLSNASSSVFESLSWPSAVQVSS